VPPIQVKERAKVGLWTFDRTVRLEAREYTVSELCALLSKRTNVRIIADGSIENEKLKLSDAEVSIWDLLETLYPDKGWKVEESAEETLVLKPGIKTDAVVEVTHRK
jgi:hypothetical protein